MRFWREVLTSYILFFVLSRRKESKEETPTASLPLKITHVFGRDARRALCALIGAPLFSKNFPDFINAPELRSGILIVYKYSFDEIRPPSRGNFYALTREVNFHVKAGDFASLYFCIFMQNARAEYSFFHFSYFEKLIYAL